MIRGVRRVLPKVKRFVRENPGVTFIIGFQVLLVVCAGLVILGNSWLANEIAIYAYCSLVIGVVLHLISFVRHQEGREDDG